LIMAMINILFAWQMIKQILFAMNKYEHSEAKKVLEEVIKFVAKIFRLAKISSIVAG